MHVLKPHVSLNVSPSLNLSMNEAPRTGINAGHFGIQVATTEDMLDAVG